MAQFEKILNGISGGIIPYEEKVSQKTYQYWQDVKKYRQVIKELESKGVTRQQLEEKGLIIPYLLDEGVKVSTMGGGPSKGGGGPSGIIPVLGTSSGQSDAISNEVSDEDFEQLQTILASLMSLNQYITPSNTSNIQLLLDELTGPEPQNANERKRRRLILRGKVQEIGEKISNEPIQENLKINYGIDQPLE